MKNYKELENRELNLLLCDQLANKKHDLCDVLGIFSLLIYNKSIFKKNIDVAVFFNEVTKIEFPAYVVSSRTLMLARSIKVIYNLDDDQLLAVVNTTIRNLRKIGYDDKTQAEEPVNKKRKNENKKLEAWMKGL